MMTGWVVEEEVSIVATPFTKTPPPVEAAEYVLPDMIMVEPAWRVWELMTTG